MPSGSCAWAEETSTKRPCVDSASGVVEGAGGVLHGPDEQVVEQLVVGERGARDGIAALPAADQVDECVGAAEAVLEAVGPVARGVGVEQVDDAASRLRSSAGRARSPAPPGARVDVGEREGGAVGGEARRDVGAEAAAGAGDRDRAAFEGASSRRGSYRRGGCRCGWDGPRARARGAAGAASRRGSAGTRRRGRGRRAAWAPRPRAGRAGRRAQTEVSAGGHVGGDEVVGGDPLAELRAVDARVVELLDALAQGGRRPRRRGPSRCVRWLSVQCR